MVGQLRIAALAKEHHEEQPEHIKGSEPGGNNQEEST